MWWLSFFFSSRRRHTRLVSDWSSDVCSSDLGIIGRDGVTSTSVLHGADTTPHEIFTQVPGSASRLGVDDLRTALRDSPSLHEHLLRYAEAFNVQVAYTALSHGSYTIEERLARWL